MIAVTGIGVISALGTGKVSTVEGLKAGQTGICSPGESQFGPMGLGEVRGFSAKDFIPAMKARRLSRFTQLALCSAIEAVEDSGLNLGEMDPFRAGAIFGTALSSTGSTDSFYRGLLENGPQDTNPMLFPETVPNAAASQVAIHFGIKGPNTTFSQNEISSELALDFAVGQLMAGRLDAALVGGAEELNPIEIETFMSLRLISSGGGSPFDRSRNGFIPAEGGAVLVLEREEDALERGAHIYARIGETIGLSSAPIDGLHYDISGGSMTDAMRMALGDIGPESIDMISAAANGTKVLDTAEAGALKNIFGSSAPVTALRSFLGSPLSDGIIRAAVTVLCMREGFVPGIPGLKDPEPEGISLSDKGEYREIRYALQNSFSFGGGAASVLFERP